MNKLKKALKCELAKREFWEYCKLKASDFYKEDRYYLKEMCDDLEDFCFNDDDILILNLPPRHGKSRSAGLLVQWLMGNDNTNKIMTASYNETLSTVFSKQVRDSIMETKADDNIIVYSDIFKNARIKRGDAAAKMWSLEGQNCNNYLATSPGGTATGFGADYIIIDDLVKSAYEANNMTILENHWDWFTNTMMSRLQGKRKIIIIMTRWSTNDLAGKAMDYFADIGMKVKTVAMKAYDGKNMLCDDVLNKKQYDILMATLGEDIASANYNQVPLNLKGALYTAFPTYNELDELPEFEGIYNYTDTADMGEDYLCSITAGLYKKKAYILDIYYTQAGMEVTEKELAKRMKDFKVNYSFIEANNGGRGFGRNVEKETRSLGNETTNFNLFTQTKNKNARILTGATTVMNCIVYPKQWKQLYKDFYRDTINYQRTAKNIHDDNADSLTGLTEKMPIGNGNTWGW